MTYEPMIDDIFMDCDGDYCKVTDINMEDKRVTFVYDRILENVKSGNIKKRPEIIHLQSLIDKIEEKNNDWKLLEKGQVNNWRTYLQ